MKTIATKHDQKEEKNDVADMLESFHRRYQEPDLSSAIELKMGEVDSFLKVITAALENKDYDESFFREHVGRTSWLLRERYEELQMLMGIYIDRTEKEKGVRAA